MSHPLTERLSMFTFLRIVAATGFALVAIIVVLVALRMNNADQSTTLWTMCFAAFVGGVTGWYRPKK